MTNPEMIIDLAEHVSTTASRKREQIDDVTRKIKMLALNALIEAARAGDAGRGFSVVANEVKGISQHINQISEEFESELVGSSRDLSALGRNLVDSIRGNRLADLALNAIEIIDRNLYERSCDVRWWATDSALVDCATSPSPENASYCSKRLGVILASYTVYLDLWVCDLAGNVISTGRPGHYPQARGANVASTSWFRSALNTRDGTEFAVSDIEVNPYLDKQAVATYACAIREGGETNGKIIGVLGIFFDWGNQARTVVGGVRLTDDELRENRTKCLIVDSKHRIIAASDERYLLEGTYPIKTNGKKIGHYEAEDGACVAFALTPGYETYAGLGWYGLIIQRSAEQEREFTERYARRR